MKGLHGWLRILENNETSVLSTLLNEIDNVITSENGSGEKLAKVILKDAFLTSRIIKVANSVMFNPNEMPVTTVSRAVINIGFENIRSICISIKVLESLLDENCSPLLLSSLAKSFHAANQAKIMCPKLSAQKKEEIFVASILSHLAELLILGNSDEEVKAFSNELLAYSTQQEKDRSAEKHLGVSITRLAKTLIKQWRMGGLPLDVVNATGFETESQSVEAVRMGDEISRASLLGWDSPEFKEIAQKVADFQGVSLKDVKKNILKVSDETAELIASLGKQGLVDYIPTSRKPAKKLEMNDAKNASGIKADERFQKLVLDKVTEMLSHDFNINNIMNLVLRGLNQGVGLERVALTLFDKQHSRFAAKYAVGDGTDTWKQKFVLSYERNPYAFLYQLFEYDQTIWVGAEQFAEITKTIRSEFSAITGQKAFFIAPLKAEGKMVGFIYADMISGGQNLNLEAFEAFHQFAKQANLALNKIAKRA